MEQTELLTLIEKCREGDPEVQEKQVVAAQNRVYYHCKKFLNNTEGSSSTPTAFIKLTTELRARKSPWPHGRGS